MGNGACCKFWLHNKSSLTESAYGVERLQTKQRPLTPTGHAFCFPKYSYTERVETGQSLKQSVPRTSLGSHQHWVDNVLGYYEPFSETLSQRVYEVCFLISWGSQWLSTEPFIFCCLSDPLLKQLSTAGEFGLHGLGMCCCQWEMRIRCDHKACPHPQHTGVCRGKTEWDQSQVFQHWDSDRRLRFHWKLTGSFKVFTLKEFSTFQIISHRVETTETESFTRLKLFRLCSYRRQHSLLFPMSLVHTSPPSRGATLLFIKQQLSVYPYLSCSCPLLIESSFP